MTESKNSPGINDDPEVIKGDILDFVWIEKYRNIQKQAFSFSTKYYYTYDEEKRILKRTSNNIYLDNFFDDNIEINAVVGENGTGKTSLLRAIFKASHGIYYGGDVFGSIILAFRNFNNDDMVVYYINSESYVKKIEKCKQNVRSIFCNLQNASFKREVYFQGNSILPCFYHSIVLDYNVFDEYITKGKSVNLQANNISLTNYDISTSSLINPQNLSGFERFGVNSINSYFYEEFSKQLRLVRNQEYDDDLFKKIFGFNRPNCISISLKKPSVIISQIKPNYNNVDDVLEDIGNQPISNITDYWMEIKNSLSNDEINADIMYCNNPITYYKNAIALGMVAVIIRMSTYSLTHCDRSNEIKTIPRILHNAIKDSLNSPWEKMIIIKQVAEKHYSLNEYINDEWEKDKKALDNFVKIIHSINSDSLIDDTLYFTLHNIKLNLPVNVILGHYFRFGKYFNFMNFSWPLSSGEEARLALFSRIYCALHKKDEENVCLLLDEADMLLHPRWQQSYVNNLLSFIKNTIVPKNSNHMQLIIATHSPIMLSDIPKQNTLFLKNNTDQNEPDETFASNIFSLYQNAFFLNEAGIGDLAEKKLCELIEDIHNLYGEESNPRIPSKVEKEKVIQRINCIGDSYIRHKFEMEFKHMIEKFEKINGKKQYLDREIEEIKKKLKVLEALRLKLGE